MIVLGRTEWIKIRSTGERAEWSSRLKAKIDTGADWSRIGAEQAADLGLGPIVKTHVITTSSGAKEKRVRVPARVRIDGIELDTHFVISTGKKNVLIGLNTMKDLSTVFEVRIDPTREYLTKSGKPKAAAT